MKSNIKQRPNYIILILIIVSSLLASIDFLCKRFFLKTDAYFNFYNILRFYYIKNKGIAFGWLSSIPSKIILWFNCFIITSFIILLIMYKWKNHISMIGLILVITGALGNFIDRLNYGYVVDYIHLYDFPVFNISDAMISLGMATIIIGELIGEVRRK